MRRGILLVMALVFAGCGNSARVRFTEDGFEVSGDLSNKQIQKLVDDFSKRLEEEREFRRILETKRTDANVTFVQSQAKHAENNPSAFDDGYTRIATGEYGYGFGYGGGDWQGPHQGVVLNQSDYTVYAVIYDAIGRNEIGRTGLLRPDAVSRVMPLQEGQYNVKIYYATSNKLYKSADLQVNGRRGDANGGLDWHVRIR